MQVLFLCARDEAIIPDSSVQAMNAGDGDEVIHTSLIHRPSFVFYRVVQMMI